MRLALAATVLLALVQLSVAGPGKGKGAGKKGVDWSARAKAVTWDLDPKATILDSVRNIDDYEVVMVHGVRSHFRLDIRIEKAGKAIHAWEGHTETPIVIAGDILYYSAHHPFSTGATIVSVDLSTGKERWRTNTVGLGPIGHSEYRNQVSLAVTTDVITVQSEESSGKYVELLDVKTGKTLATDLR